MPYTLKDFEPFFKSISTDAILIPNDKIIASKIVFWDDSFMEGSSLFVNGAKIIKGDLGKRKYYPCGTILFRGRREEKNNILILPGRTINRSITIPFIAIADKIYLTNGNNDGIGGNSTVLAAIGIFTLTDTEKSVNAVALLDDIAYGLKHPITAKDVNGKYITLRNNSLETTSLSLTFDTSLLETNGAEFVSLNGTGSGTAYGVPVEGPIIITFTNELVVTLEYSIELGGQGLPPGATITGSGEYLYGSGAEVLGFSSDTGLTISFTDPKFTITSSDNGKLHYQDIIINDSATVEINGDVTTITAGGTVEIGGQELPIGTVITNNNGTISYAPPSGSNVWGITSAGTITVTYSNGVYTMSSTDTLVYNEAIITGEINITFPNDNMTIKPISSAIVKVGSEQLDNHVVITNNGTTNVYSFPNKAAFGVTSDGELSMTYQHDNVNDIDLFSTTSTSGQMEYLGIALSGMNIIGFSAGAQYVTTTEDYEVGGHSMSAGGSIMDNRGVNNYIYTNGANVFKVVSTTSVTITYNGIDTFTYSSSALTCNGIPLITPYTVTFTNPSVQEIKYTDSFSLGGQSMPSGTTIVYDADNDSYSYACPPNVGIWGITSDGIITLTYNNTDTFIMKSTTNKFIYTNSDGEFDIETSLLTIPVTSDTASYLSENIDKFSYKNLYYIGNAQIKIGVYNDTMTITEAKGVISFGDLYTSSSSGRYSEYTIPYSKFIAPSITPSITTLGYLSNSTYSYNIQLQFGRLDASIDNGVPNLKITSGQFWILIIDMFTRKGDISSDSSLDYTLQYDSNANGPYLHFTDMTTDLSITSNGYIRNATSLEIENVSYGSSLVEGNSLTIIGKSSLLNDYNSDDTLTVTTAEPLTYTFGDGSNVYVSMSHNKISYNSGNIKVNSDNTIATANYTSGGSTTSKTIYKDYPYTIPFNSIG